MKTILIPIFHGHTARNILRTNVLKELQKEAKIVLIVPAFKQASYQEEFGSDRIVVEKSPEIIYSKIDRLFRSFYYYFVDTETVKIIQQEEFLERKLFKYWVSRIFTKLFGNLRILRKIIRFLDYLMVKDRTFTKIFDKYSPDLVFIPSITSDDEGLVLRQAISRRTKSVGMVRSWDNISVNKGNLRVFPDKMLVHTSILKKDLVELADYPRQKIEVVGMSHFDYYITDRRIPREEFFSMLKGDPLKKTIYFMPIGLSDIKEDKYMLGLLEGWVKDDKDFNNTQLMISLHPNAIKPISYINPETLFLKFPSLKDYPGGKPTDREITGEHMELMASAIYHSDVIVNYQSTTTIDVAAFNKPIVNIAFDGLKDKPYLKSVRRFYDFTHYLPILGTGGVRLARSSQEMRDEIVEYLRNPEKDNEGRRRIVEQQAPYHDGKASHRTAAAILSVLNG